MGFSYHRAVIIEENINKIVINMLALCIDGLIVLLKDFIIPDYKTEVGTPILYRKYRHNSVESFLQILPSLCVLVLE